MEDIDRAIENFIGESMVSMSEWAADFAAWENASWITLAVILVGMIALVRWWKWAGEADARDQEGGK